ncbi:hypothetical protein TREES_T100010528 [Tupaia chinensis]|uniref:Uncharacterized protein n=1 Tax=Tupaia chinensis TaxID=246437 RepID=L9LE36_TUPCH|nr:hypothetical protein TREES_T100010528 [Tupaia chinensis]
MFKFLRRQSEQGIGTCTFSSTDCRLLWRHPIQPLSEQRGRTRETPPAPFSLHEAHDEEQPVDLRALDYVDIVHGASGCTQKTAVVGHQGFPAIEYRKATGDSEEVTSQGKSSLSTINIPSVATQQTSHTDPTPTDHSSSRHQRAEK